MAHSHALPMPACTCRVSWDPSCERADVIRREARAGRLQLGDGSRLQPQQQAGTQATVGMPPARQPDTQQTPLVHWSHPDGTQVAPATTAVAAMPAAASQAPAAGGSAWKQLAADVLRVLAPQGVDKKAAIQQMKALDGDKARWLAAGTRAFAAEVARRLGRHDVQV